jgi:integrase
VRLWILASEHDTVEAGRGTQVVRERSAKPLCVGSIPTRASNRWLLILNNLQIAPGLLEKLCYAAKLKRNGRTLRCHPHMFRHTFAVEKPLGGAALEDVSLLLGHHSIKVTERHYLRFDQRRQDRLTKASMVDWHQIQKPIVPARKKRPQLVMSKAAGR